MLNATIIGRVANKPKVKTDSQTGKPYLILEIRSPRTYKNPDGSRTQDVVPVMLYDRQVLRYKEYGFKGCKVAVAGTLETNPTEHPGSFLVKGLQVEYLTFRAPAAKKEALPVPEPENQPETATPEQEAA